MADAMRVYNGDPGIQRCTQMALESVRRIEVVIPNFRSRVDRVLFGIQWLAEWSGLDIECIVPKSYQTECHNTVTNLKNHFLEGAEAQQACALYDDSEAECHAAPWSDWEADSDDEQNIRMEHNQQSVRTDHSYPLDFGGTSDRSLVDDNHNYPFAQSKLMRIDETKEEFNEFDVSDTFLPPNLTSAFAALECSTPEKQPEKSQPSRSSRATSKKTDPMPSGTSLRCSAVDISMPKGCMVKIPKESLIGIGSVIPSSCTISAPKSKPNSSHKVPKNLKIMKCCVELKNMKIPSFILYQLMGQEIAKSAKSRGNARTNSAKPSKNIVGSDKNDRKQTKKTTATATRPKRQFKRKTNRFAPLHIIKETCHELVAEQMVTVKQPMEPVNTNSPNPNLNSRLKLPFNPHASNSYRKMFAKNT